LSNIANSQKVEKAYYQQPGTENWNDITAPWRKIRYIYQWLLDSSSYVDLLRDENFLFDPPYLRIFLTTSEPDFFWNGYKF